MDKFYPIIKKHISPSAFASWHNARSLFIRSYFKNEKTPETAAMRDGKKIHALIEAGFLNAQKRFDIHEEPITIMLENGVEGYGIPDSVQAQAVDGVIEFTDYKTGKEDKWSNEELVADLKMKMTAWLVYKKAKEAGQEVSTVKGYIEFFQVAWNAEQKENVPVSDDSAVYEVTYSAEDLEAFTELILLTIEKVNEEYLKFLAGSTEFMNEEDMARYAELETEKALIEAEQDEIKKRISEQMLLGLQKTVSSPFGGTFYFTERKKYEYPEDLHVDYDKGYNLKDIEEVESKISTSIKAAKSNYELGAEPISITRSLSYRAPTKAKKNAKSTD